MRGMKWTYRWCLVSLLSVLVAANVVAQADYPYLVDQHDFIRYDLNHLQFPGGEDALDPLYAKMDRLLFEGKGQINVVHIGGSHIQADMWSDRMRQRLQTFFPGVRGARGLLFPFKMAKTNNPYNYFPEWTGKWEACKNIHRNADCTLGLTGMSVTTRDSLATLRISFRGDGYPQYECKRVRVFHDMGPESFSLRIATPGVNAQVRTNEALGYTEFLLDKHVNAIDLEFFKTDVVQTHFTLYGLSLDNDDPGFVYTAIGVNGAATPSYRRCKLFPQHMEAVRPDLIIFSVGINDAHCTTSEFDADYYARNYDTLVDWVRRANPDAAILFTTNNDSYYKRKYPNRNAEKVREVMLSLAQRHRAVVWDMYGVMGGLGSIRTWVQAGLANKDKIHMLKPGYVLLADLMFNALMEPYDAHLRSLHQTDAQHR